MSGEAGASRTDGPPVSAFGWAVLAAAVACLVGAGGLLWWRRGDAVFGDLVMAGLAWCF